MTTKPTRPPPGLGASGRALWTSVAAQINQDRLTFDPRELALLSAACKELDQLAIIEAALVGAPMTVLRAQRQMVAHPLLGEARRSRVAMHSLLKGIGLDGPVVAKGLLGSGLTKTQAGRKGGLARRDFP